MTQGLGAGGYHWQDSNHVERWDEGRRAMAAERAVGFAAMLDHLPDDLSAPLRIVDLGAGDGKVAAVVLDRYPAASSVLVDFSELMMRKGIERLARFQGRYSYLHWDMNGGDWPAELGGPFNAVVSSAAIHHLSNERKKWLNAAVAARLAPGGVFANYDLFRDPGAVLGDDETHDRTCATLEEAASFLEGGGFVDVLVTARSPRPKHKGQLALLVGRTPGP
jgi:trans-aconitate methyltransferase